MIDKNSIADYLKLVDFNTLDENKFTIIEFSKTNKSRFDDIENISIEYKNESRSASYWDNNRRKLILDIEI